MKYNEPGGSVAVSFGIKGNGKIRLGVKDTGHGIPDDKREKIFMPFERFDMSAEQIEGAGIGLTISQKLIELMKGSIGFESIVGEGSFIYVDVPASDKKALPTQIEEQLSSTQSDLRTDVTKKILYIDDIPANLELVKQILLKRQDMEFLSAQNAWDGIELIKSRKPELVLMDIHMPGMNGLSAFNKLKTIKGVEDIPVIAVTADAMDTDVKHAMEMGFKGYITKPINISKFLDEVDRVLASTTP